ncbi:MAG: hypothetical protein NTU95_06560 [Methanothrix sp.]|nr:hypothetical protein [Methanothrix sp.]
MTHTSPRVAVSNTGPLISALQSEMKKKQRRRTVSHLVEEVITGRVDAFVLPEEKA